MAYNQIISNTQSHDTIERLSCPLIRTLLLFLSQLFTTLQLKMIALVGLALLPSLLISAQPLEVRQYGGGSYNDPASPPTYTAPALPTAINITADALINYYNASNVFIPPPPVVYQATCTNIMIPVTVSSNNTNITAVGLPKNNREVTAIVNSECLF